MFSIAWALLALPMVIRKTHPNMFLITIFYLIYFQLFFFTFVKKSLVTVEKLRKMSDFKILHLVVYYDLNLFAVSAFEYGEQ